MDADRLCRRWSFIFLFEIHSGEWFFRVRQEQVSDRSQSSEIILTIRVGVRNIKSGVKLLAFERCLAVVLPIAERVNSVYGFVGFNAHF